MADSKQNFARKDTRMACKYGAECYQKNPFHLSKFKHPPKKAASDEAEEQRPSKVRKVNDEEQYLKKFTNNVSDSDDDLNAVDVTETISERNKCEETPVNDDLEIPGASSMEITPPTTVEQKIPRKENEMPTRFNCKIRNDVSDSEEEEAENKEDSADESTTVHFAEKNQKATNNLLRTTDNEDKPEDSANVKPNRARLPLVIDEKQFIKDKFLVEMPPDFYNFWQFCAKIDKVDPLLALRDVGLFLVGPFDVLAGKFAGAPERSAEDYLLHWRYYFDVPEFQTVLKGDDKTGYHIGYFRDSPSELPVFLACNKAGVGGVFSEMGGNIFAALSLYLDELKKTGDPFKRMHVSRFAALAKAEAEKLNLNLSPRTQAMRNRSGKVVAKTFNKIGLVVPYDRKSQVGYRELALPDKELREILEKLAVAGPEQKDRLLVRLQPVLTYASIATDECDFGTGVELGWNIISCGVDSLNSTVASFLATSYRLLDRQDFALVIEAHMKNRRKGTRLSIL